MQQRVSISPNYTLLVWGKSILSHAPLHSFQYVLVLLKRYITSQLWVLRQNDPAMVQVSLQCIPCPCRAVMFVVVPLNNLNTRNLDSSEVSYSVDLSASLDSFLKIITPTDSCNDEIVVERCFNQSWDQ